jgi:hypothetical protein
MITILEAGQPVGRVSSAAALAVWLRGRSPRTFTYADHLGERISTADINEALGLSRLREAASDDYGEIGERKFDALLQDLRRVRNSAVGIASAMDEQQLSQVWDALMSIFEICGGDPDASLA